MIKINLSEDVAEVLMEALNDYRNNDFEKQDILDSIRASIVKAEEEGEFGIMVSYEG